MVATASISGGVRKLSLNAVYGRSTLPASFSAGKPSAPVTLSVGPQVRLSKACTGSVVVGNASFGGPNSHAFRWTTGLGAMEDLGAILPNGFSSGRAVSDDGSTVIGVAQVTGGVFSQAAMMWREGSGMVDLNTYLPSIGISTGGMYLYEGLDVSADGLTIMGSGFDAQFGFKAWVVTIPTPGSGAVVLAGLAVIARRRR